MNHNAWDHAVSLADKHSNQGGLFVRLSNNHDKIVGAFCGVPYTREVVWTGERYETYDPSIHTDKRPSLRVMLNFYVPAESDMKVIEGGTAWLKDLLKVRDKYGLDKWLFEIERHGEARDPKTKYTILPEERIDETTQARIQSAGLHDLAALVGEEEEVVVNASPRSSTPEFISPEQANELVERLKQLPRSDVDHFLTRFEAGRVRDIRAADLPAARAFLRMDEAPRQEIDPFA